MSAWRAFLRAPCRIDGKTILMYVRVGLCVSRHGCDDDATPNRLREPVFGRRTFSVNRRLFARPLGRSDAVCTAWVLRSEWSVAWRCAPVDFYQLLFSLGPWWEIPQAGSGSQPWWVAFQRPVVASVGYFLLLGQSQSFHSQSFISALWGNATAAGCCTCFTLS